MSKNKKTKAFYRARFECLTDISKMSLKHRNEFHFILANPIIQCLGRRNDPQCSRKVLTTEFSTVELWCRSTGNPTPISFWKKWSNGTRMRINDVILKVC